MTKYKCEKWELQALLEDFSAEVADGKYRRLPYTIWKQLKNLDVKKIKIYDLVGSIEFIGTNNTIVEVCSYEKEETQDFINFAKHWLELLGSEEKEKEKSLPDNIDLNTITIKPDSSDGCITFVNADNTTQTLNLTDYDKLEACTLNSKISNTYDTTTSISINDSTLGCYSPYSTTTTDWGVYQTQTIDIAKVAQVDSVNLKIDQVVEELVEKYDLKEKIDIERKDTNTMNMFSKLNFDFGPANADAIRLSPFGMAIKTPNRQWHTYDAVNKKIVDVDDFAFNFGSTSMFYKMPVAPDAVAIGDVILHNARPVFVIDFVDVKNKASGIVCIDTDTNEQKTILPVCNVFNFNFITKIVSLFNMTGNGTGNIFGTPSADQPFGNIFGMMMMSEMFKDNGKSGDNDFFRMMMMSQMFSGGVNPFAQMFSGFAATPAKSPAVGGPMDA